MPKHLRLKPCILLIAASLSAPSAFAASHSYSLTQMYQMMKRNNPELRKFYAQQKSSKDLSTQHPLCYFQTLRETTVPAMTAQHFQAPLTVPLLGNKECFLPAS